MTKIPAPMQWGIEHMDSLDEILLRALTSIGRGEQP